MLPISAISRLWSPWSFLYILVDLAHFYLIAGADVVHILLQDNQTTDNFCGT